MTRSAAWGLILAAALACAACSDSSPTTTSSDSCPTSSIFTDPPDLTVDSPCNTEVSALENAARVYEFVPPAAAAYTVGLVYTDDGNADVALNIYDTLTPAGSTSYFLEDPLLTCDDGGVGDGESCTTPSLSADDSIYLKIHDKQAVGGTFTLTVTQE